MRHLTRGTAVFGAGTLVGAVLVGGIAYAAIPATNTGNITACVNKSTGVTRIIDFQSGKRCRSTERTVNWNARGPAGVSGLTTVIIKDTVATAGSYTRLHAVCPAGTVVLSATGFWKESVSLVGTALYTGIADDTSLVSNIPGKPFRSASAFSEGSGYNNDAMYLELVCAAAH